MGKILPDDLLKIKAISISEFCSKFHNGLKPQAIDYAIENNKLDWTKIGSERLIVLTDKTLKYTPNASNKRKNTTNGFEEKLNKSTNNVIEQKEEVAIIYNSILKKEDKYYLKNSLDIDVNESLFLKELIRLKKNKAFVNSYFDLINEIFLSLGIEENSSKVSMSVGQKDLFPVTIGQRYIIALKEENELIRVAFPIEYFTTIERYSDKNTCDIYYFKQPEDAFLINLKYDFFLKNKTSLINIWKKALDPLVSRTEKSSFLSSHNPYFNKAIVDLEYRKTILSKIPKQ